jgi:DnaK suppressor protein
MAKKKTDDVVVQQEVKVEKAVKKPTKKVEKSVIAPSKKATAIEDKPKAKATLEDSKKPAPKVKEPLVELVEKVETKPTAKKSTKKAVNEVTAPVIVETKPAAKKSTKKVEPIIVTTKDESVKEEVKSVVKKPTKKEETTSNPEATEDVKPFIKEPQPNDPDYTGPKYSDEDLEEFRVRIMEVKQESMDELRMLRERLEDYTNYDFAEESMIYSMHMAEQGPEALEQEKTYAQVQRISEYIKKLEDALNRIKDKSYGICRVCKCLIAKERLLAVPITTLSASHKIHKRCPEDGIDRIEPLKK